MLARLISYAFGVLLTIMLVVGNIWMIGWIDTSPHVSSLGAVALWCVLLMGDIASVALIIGGPFEYLLSR